MEKLESNRVICPRSQRCGFKMQLHVLLCYVSMYGGVGGSICHCHFGSGYFELE